MSLLKIFHPVTLMIVLLFLLNLQAGHTESVTKLETLKGTVVEITKTPVGEPDGGLKFVLRTKSGDYAVHLGPQFMNNPANAKGVGPGDQVMVMGLTLSFDSFKKRKAFQAHEVRKSTEK